MTYTLRVDRAKLQGVGMTEARRLVNRVVRRTFNRSQILCPVDTGNLRASGRMELGSDRGALVIGSVVYGARYAAAVHEGRRALTIRARRPGGKLKFTIGGKTIYATQVHQPARAGRPFLRTALVEAASEAGFRVTIG
jgi:hypothetical protein